MNRIETLKIVINDLLRIFEDTSVRYTDINDLRIALVALKQLWHEINS